MDPMAERLNKLREERLAREKARIEKLREMNLKKYSKLDEPTTSNSSSNHKPVKSDVNVKRVVKNNFHVNGTTKRPISAPIPKPKDKDLAKQKIGENHVKVESKVITNSKNINAEKKIPNLQRKTSNHVTFERKPSGHKNNYNEPSSKPPHDQKLTTDRNALNNHFNKFDKKPVQAANGGNKTLPSSNLTRKSFAVTEKAKPNMSRKSLAVPARPPQSACKNTTASSNNVFERLYKQKTHQTSHASDIQKLQTDPNYLKKVIRTTNLILNKRHTVFDTKPKVDVPVRRSISAVHFKRISKQELGHCIHKWSSIGDKLNNIHLKHVNEDETVKEDKVISAVKSERKKVKFMTPMTNFNTPRPEELQARLKAWLQKRGKSLDSYHHLQCFGIHHLPHNLRFDPNLYDDENKENIAVESDSDDDSYTENMNEESENAKNKWRSASIVSDSVDFNETQNTTLTCSDVINTDEVLTGALNDLTELLKEGFDWEQCARWLRAIRERFPSAPNSSAYWECRAALEERRGDLPASVQCWEEAIAKGTEHSVVEANLDQLLDKFMQLKISPNSSKSRRQVDPKLVDVKNVFKSTIIRFAVQQAKLRQSNQFSPAPRYSVTPVRRSARLSIHSHRTPLQTCTSVRQAGDIVGETPLFIPNQNLHGTP